ncbi:DUF1433 domain-containing protein [Virgibacillus halodenitrificans]|nr:DUF1433 domain-containing protein [Virgibacillus halodenitrificans]MCG1027643.1 DUF1433 domain-containing protein [Virgibacillus halodenitrificans]MEC2157683.1 DUF1433 domain-containing protein [Virgibacillus halodenitrificans]
MRTGDKVIDQAKQKVESYIRNNYENINKITFSNDTSDPMGGLMIRETVNDKVDFSASVDPKELSVQSLGETKGFPEVKEECKEKICDY